MPTPINKMKTNQLKILEELQAQTKLLQEIYKQLLNPWTGKSIAKNDCQVNDKYFHIIDDGMLKTSEILAECKKKFDVYSWYNNEKLDKDFPPVKSDRYFKKNLEADEELKNKSANELEKMGVKGMTLRERLLMELAYFNETGQHLDIDNITLCSGSRYSDGDVPDVSWGVDHRGLCVGRYDPGTADDDLRARAVVSNPLSS
jgi:hypothetical protein